MTPEELERSCADDVPPVELGTTPCGALLKALWLTRRGNWDAAHAIAQDDEGPDGAWVHAHLHRVEGDLGNAGYWYGRAGRPRCEAPLELEWHSIAAELFTR